MSSIAYPLIALALTHSAVDAGLVGLANTAPFVLLQLPAGLYVDRWNRRAILLLSDGGRALAVGGVCVLLFLGHLAFWELVAAAVVEGSLFVPFRLAQAASLPRVVPPDQLSDAIAFNQGQSFGTSLAGQPVGGLLYSLRSAFPFLADAISYGASLLSIAIIRTPLGAPEAPQDRNLTRELREGLAFAWNHRFIRSTALLTVGSDFVINGLFLLLVVIVRQNGGSAALIGVMLGIGSVGGVLGSVAAPYLRRRIHSLRLVIAGVAWVDAPLVVLMAVTRNPLGLGVLLGLMLAPWPFWNAVVGARTMTQIPDRLMGRVQSAVTVLGWAPVPLAPLTAGLLLQFTGRVPTILIFGVLMLGVAVTATLNRAVRDASAAAITPADPISPSPAP
jgi:MFS family permease